jgi:cysteine synthase A
MGIMIETGFATAARFRSLGRAIGNTPMLQVHYRFRGQRRTIFAKSEQLNMTGSIKDRMAFYVLESAYQEGKLKSGDTIIEATSGNTGISFAALGRALGHPVIIYMPDWMSRERMDLIRAFGAEVVPVSKDDGGFVGAIQMVEERGKKEENVFLPRQFSNEANTHAHERTTGPEIFTQLRGLNLVPDAFVAGVGTGGTVMGVGRCLKERTPHVRIHPVEPVESPTLTAGHKIGHHRIQGVSDEFVPAIVNLSELNAVIAVSDGDAILMAQSLASHAGLGVGISSGANFLAAVMAQEELGKDAVVVTVFPDDNKKYLSTALLQDEPVKKGYLTPEIELMGTGILRRVCSACV